MSQAGPSNFMIPTGNAAQKRRASDDPSGRNYKRTRSGCFTCRLRRKKCDEGRPSCQNCASLHVKCDYEQPIWWGSTELRSIQKEIIKDNVKQNRVTIKNNNALVGIVGNGMSTTDQQPSATSSAAPMQMPMPMQMQMPMTMPMTMPMSMSMPMATPPTSDFNFVYPYFPEERDPFASHLPTPNFAPFPYGQEQQQGQQHPYEVDVTTERQLFVNDVQTRTDTSVSTFNTFAPPQLQGGLPNLPENTWITHPSTLLPSSFTTEVHPVPAPSSMLPPDTPYPEVDDEPVIEDQDRPLLNHFVDNVLRIFFPIVEAYKGGEHEHVQAVRDSLETNKSYLHCCLSVAAIHLKSTIRIKGKPINKDILRHRFEAVSHLCDALNRNTKHAKILDSTLAMIFFHCAVGFAEDDLPDIAWHDHFQAAISLLRRLDILNMTSITDPLNPPFSLTLSTWIDILGATMIGRSPEFAHTYRTKNLGAIPSGLVELMGCEDRVMYLISEIACLDALKEDGVVNEMALCGHVQALGEQLEHSEPFDQTLAKAYDKPNGVISPEKLTKTITAIFRLAARLYLCSLVPGFDRYKESTMNIVEAATRAIEYIPDGPNGYDRTLVWPLLIVGTYSVPMSSLRCVMHRRMIELGDHADFGSFGRLYRLLQEIWKLSDRHFSPMTSSFPAGSPATITSPHTGTRPMREIRPQTAHWRYVMGRKGWKYLLI